MADISSTTYQASDLSRNYRHVLNSARQEDTLIRDTDGETLLMLSLDRARRDRTMSTLLADFARLLHAHSKGDRLGIINSGKFSFAALLPNELQNEMLEDIYAALQIAQSGGSLDSVNELIEDWIATSDVWANDNLRQEIFAVDVIPPADVL